MKIEFPQNITSKKARLDYLYKNKSEIIQIKKAAIKFADAFDNKIIKLPSTVIKSATTKQDSEDVIYRTIVGNTYNWLDSHDDVHLNNCFKKSIEETGDKVKFLHDHVYQLTAKVGNVKPYESMLGWKQLGVNKEGQTMCLLGDADVVAKYNQLIFDDYKAGEIQQHSVGMFYVQIKFCADNPDWKEDYANYKTYLPLLGNPEKAEEQGYFYAIAEAKLKEISCVFEGSNVLTPTLSPEKSIDLNQLEKYLTEKGVSKEIISQLCNPKANNEPPRSTQKKKPQQHFFAIMAQKQFKN